VSNFAADLRLGFIFKINVSQRLSVVVAHDKAQRGAF
jgi:hypothetical protein